MSRMKVTDPNSFDAGIEKLPTREPTQRQANAVRVSLIAAIVLTVVGLADFVYTLQVPQGDYRSSWLIGVVAVTALISWFLSRRGQVTQGIMILAGGLILACLVFPFLNTGVSIQVGVIVAILGFVLSIRTLAADKVAMVIVPVFIAAMAGMLLDFYVPIDAPQGNANLASGLAAFCALVYGIYLAREFHNYPLRGKLVIAFLLVGLLPMISLAFLNHRQSAARLESEIQQEISATAEQNANRVDEFIRSELDSVRLAAQMHQVTRYFDMPDSERDGSEAATEAFEFLVNMGRKDPIFLNSYALLDMAGINRLDTVTENVGRDESWYEYFTHSVGFGLPYLSPVLFMDGEPTLYFSSPVRGQGGTIIGVLRVAYNATILQSLLVSSGASEAEGLYSVLVDDAYFIRLAHSQDADLLYKSYAEIDADLFLRLQSQKRLPLGAINLWVTHQQPLVDAVQNIQQEPFFIIPGLAIGGAEALSTAVHLDQAPWLILARRDMAAVNAPLEEQMRSTVTLALAAIVLVFIATIMVSQLIAAPMTGLTQVAEQVAAGDLSARAHITTEDEVGRLAVTFNTMTAQLQETLRGLEERVADRTRALELSSDVSRRLSTILDPARLVHEVVEQLQATFNYYHVHIYLYDERKENLVMVGGTGEAGQQLLERGHKLPAGRGLVGRACDSASEVLVQDTQQDPNWAPNPLLPDTRSEIAVPILFGDEVLGALDVQQNRVDALDRQDADLLRGIANQVAIALQNANRFTHTQRHAERETLIAGIIQQIQDTRTVPEALQVAAREVGRALHAPRTRVGVRLTPAAGQNGGAAAPVAEQTD